jgi:hypothetical protein
MAARSRILNRAAFPYRWEVRFVATIRRAREDDQVDVDAEEVRLAHERVEIDCL